jgi:hypothetical protein
VPDHKPGEALESWCTKCREMKPHTIKSINPADGRPARVLCDVCTGEHNYRPSPPQSRRSSAGKKPTAKKKVGVVLTEAQKGTARPYELDGTFKEGEVIHHPTFGFGAVTEIRSAQRMMVEFDTYEKQLVFNMSATTELATS